MEPLEVRVVQLNYISDKHKYFAEYSEIRIVCQEYGVEASSLGMNTYVHTWKMAVKR
jgi:hypothetical protein